MSRGLTALVVRSRALTKEADRRRPGHRRRRKLRGIITDRHLVVRVIAEGKDPDVTEARDCCSEQLTTLQPDASVDDAVPELFRRRRRRCAEVVRRPTPSHLELREAM